MSLIPTWLIPSGRGRCFHRFALRSAYSRLHFSFRILIMGSDRSLQGLARSKGMCFSEGVLAGVQVPAEGPAATGGGGGQPRPACRFSVTAAGFHLWAVAAAISSHVCWTWREPWPFTPPRRRGVRWELWPAWPSLCQHQLPGSASQEPARPPASSSPPPPARRLLLLV